ncbi:MAG: ribbon-helix-helix protein, CopG family [Candidatus Bathyarchaeia archaeon]
MRRKGWVKVYLSKEQKQLLDRIAQSLGIGESEVLRQAFMDYAKSLSLVTDKVHGKI